MKKVSFSSSYVYVCLWIVLYNGTGSGEKRPKRKRSKTLQKTEPKKEVADTTATTVAASGAFAQFAE